MDFISEILEDKHVFDLTGFGYLQIKYGHALQNKLSSELEVNIYIPVSTVVAFRIEY